MAAINSLSSEVYFNSVDSAKEIRAIKRALTRGLGSLYLLVHKNETNIEAIKEANTANKLRVEIQDEKILDLNSFKDSIPDRLSSLRSAITNDISSELNELRKKLDELRKKIDEVEKNQKDDKEIKLEKIKNSGKILTLLIPGLLALILQIIQIVVNSSS